MVEMVRLTKMLVKKGFDNVEITKHEGKYHVLHICKNNGPAPLFITADKKELHEYLNLHYKLGIRLGNGVKMKQKTIMHKLDIKGECILITHSDCPEIIELVRDCAKQDIVLNRGQQEKLYQWFVEKRTYKYKIIVDAGKPYDIDIKNYEELKQQLKKLKKESEKDNHHFDVIILNDKDEHITETPFIQEMIAEILEED